jgi:hypothetical protein
MTATHKFPIPTVSFDLTTSAVTDRLNGGVLPHHVDGAIFELEVPPRTVPGDARFVPARGRTRVLKHGVGVARSGGDPHVVDPRAIGQDQIHLLGVGKLPLLHSQDFV